METKIKDFLCRMAFFAADGMGEDKLVEFAKQADALLNEINNAKPGKVPDGYVLVPIDMTSSMMKGVQLNSELGAYATENLSGAYGLFSEFWSEALSAAPKQEGAADAIKLLQYMVDRMSDNGEGFLVIENMNGQEVVAEWLPAAKAILADGQKGGTPC